MASDTIISTNADSVCVQVFAKITASVSHEIKNVLAIINENGGLLDDLVMLGDPDQGVAPERVKSATGTIARQVQRANIIMKNINRFAHLGDTTLREESLGEILGLMTALADRQAAMKNITLSVDCPAELQITAPMLPLASLIYLTLRGLIDIANQGGNLQVAVEKNNNMLDLHFKGEYMATDTETIFPEGNIAAVAALLGAKLEIAEDALVCRIPAGR